MRWVDEEGCRPGVARTGGVRDPCLFPISQSVLLEGSLDPRWISEASLTGFNCEVLLISRLLCSL